MTDAPRQANSGFSRLNLWVFFWVSCLLGGCQQTGDDDQAQGEALAQGYCATCHVFPSPSLLDKESWTTSVLPEMGHRLGIYSTQHRDSIVTPITSFGIDAGLIYPPEPMLSHAEWELLKDYYLTQAPETLEIDVPRPAIGLDNFRLQEAPLRFSVPLTTLVDVKEEHGFYLIANYAANNALLAMTPSHELIRQFDLEQPAVDVEIDGSRLLILTIGAHPTPSDASDGVLYTIDGASPIMNKAISNLKRPVDLSIGDLDGDGLTDLVICEFGHSTGFVSWYKQTAGAQYERRVLSEHPGAAQAVLHDLNQDNRLDIIVLMAQGDEGVDVFLNEGAGNFSRQRVIRFPPLYGSFFIELADFNRDGRPDILYVNGDNGDYSPITKPYHGIRIYLGTETGTFEESYFYPMPGAIKAQSADFDLDGDLDIAAIAYFPDYDQAPEASFVYLENQGGLTFAPSTFEDAQRGRWLVMDVGDLDGDADKDIVLGSNIALGVGEGQPGLFERWQREAPSYLILNNIQ